MRHGRPVRRNRIRRPSGQTSVRGRPLSSRRSFGNFHTRARRTPCTGTAPAPGDGSRIGCTSPRRLDPEGHLDAGGLKLFGGLPNRADWNFTRINMVRTILELILGPLRLMAGRAPARGRGRARGRIHGKRTPEAGRTRPGGGGGAPTLQRATKLDAASAAFRSPPNRTNPAPP